MRFGIQPYSAPAAHSRWHPSSSPEVVAREAIHDHHEEEDALEDEFSTSQGESGAFDSFDDSRCQLQPDFLITSSPQKLSFRGPDSRQRSREASFEQYSSDASTPVYSELDWEEEQDMKHSYETSARFQHRAWGLDDLLQGCETVLERNAGTRSKAGSRLHMSSPQMKLSLLKQPLGSTRRAQAAEFRVDRVGINVYHPGRKVCYYWNAVRARARTTLSFGRLRRKTEPLGDMVAVAQLPRGACGRGRP
jgi:hypothetical protein